MFIRKKPKPLLLALLTCATFSVHATSWWDTWKSAGDDGNPNTQGNAAAATAKSQSPIIYVAIVNNTNTILGSAVLKDNKTGKVVYTSTKGKTCAIGSVCRLRVARTALHKDTTFFFYDTKNKLTSAYMVKETPATGAMGYDIGVSMNSLGMYVLNKIQAINPKIDYKRIDKDIVTTTLKATPYEELADYYLDLLGNSKDDSKVIASLATQFTNNKSIPANPDSVRLAQLKSQKLPVQRKVAVKKAVVKSERPVSLQSSNTPENVCSTTFLSALDVVSKTPIPIASNLADIANTFISSGCDTSKSMADQFSELSEQVTTLQNTMDDTYNLVSASSQKQVELSMIKSLVDTQLIGVELSTWVNNYGTYLATLKDANGQSRNSVTDIINSYGGVENAIAKNPDMYLALNSLYSNSHQVHIALNSLGETQVLDSLKTNLNALCKNGNNIVDGVFNLRGYCDAVIASAYMKNAVMAEKLRYAYKDINAVYNMDPRTVYKGSLKWDNIPDSDFNKCDNKLEILNPKNMFFKMIEPTDVVAKTVANLQKLGFTVNEWYPDKTKRYLDVEETTVARGSKIKSRYAYQEPVRSGTDLTYPDNGEINERVVNVMGVPVPERFFTAKGNNGVAKDRNNYGAIEAFPWADKSILAETGSNNHDFPNAVVTADFKISSSGKPAIYADGFHPEYTFNSGRMYLQDNDGSNTTEKYDGVSFQRQIFKKDQDKYVVSTTGYRDWKLVGSGEYFTYIRYTGTDGYSTIWAMRTWLEPHGDLSPSPVPNYRLYSSPQCMTNDCVTVNNGNRLEKLTFKQGSSIEWSYETLSSTHNAFSLKNTQ